MNTLRGKGKGKGKYTGISLLLTVSLFLTVFIMTDMAIAGYFGLLLMFFLALYHNATYTGMSLKCDSVFIVSVCYLLVLLVRILTQREFYKNTFNSFFVQFVFVILAQVLRNSKLSYRIWKPCIVTYAVIITMIGGVLLLASSLTYSDLFGSAYGNLLYIASVFCLIVFVRENNKFLFILSVSILVLTWFSGTRSAFVSEIVMYVVWFVFSKKNFKFKTYYMLFVIMVAFCFSIPYLYLALFYATNAGGWLGTISTFMIQFVREKTGANFYSGRQILWPYIIEALNERFIFGHGVGFSPSEIYNTSFSTHNLFFFCRSETGIIGFISFILLLFDYLKKIYWNTDSRIVGLAFMSSLMLQQTFSLGLLSGKGSFAVPCWFIFAILSLKDDFDMSGKSGQLKQEV